MIKIITRLIMLSLVFVLMLSVFIGCAEPPSDRNESDTPPSSEQENGNPEDEIVPEPDKHVDGYLLSIDGAPLAYIENEETVKTIVDSLIQIRSESLSNAGKNVQSVEITSSFELELVKCLPEEIIGAERAVEKLVANGIRITYAVTESEILPIAYETVYKNSSAYYEGTKKVQTSGKNGEKQRIHLVQYENDKEVNKVLKEEKTVKQAVNEVILVGTKKSTASTGSYAWPTKNVYITSNYGWRTVFGKREYHYGIDLRASVGTSIYAADGGKVIYVGTSGGYGKLIKIQHDNGDVTYYAHLNSYSVKKGDRVYKGQLIAKSGKTGRVTGPHLHFEIRKNGVRVNPTKYLPKL